MLRANNELEAIEISLRKVAANAGRIVGVASVYAGSRCSKCLKTINISSIVFPNRDHGWICSQMGLDRGSHVALRQNGGLRAARFFRKRKFGATSTDVQLYASDVLIIYLVQST